MDKKLLRDSADKIIGNYTYFRQLTESERLDRKDRISDTLIFLSEKNEELKEIQKELKEEMKPYHEELKSLLKEIKINGQEVTEEVYVHFDQEADRATYFNTEGIEIYNRRLLPDEKQTTMFKAINQ